MGTWIEIDNIRNHHHYIPVVPYVGTWIEIRFARFVQVEAACRSLRGNVDRNVDFLHGILSFTGRSLRGNVDRNLLQSRSEPLNSSVVPYVGTWIEMETAEVNIRSIYPSFPTWERG